MLQRTRKITRVDAFPIRLRKAIFLLTTNLCQLYICQRNDVRSNGRSDRLSQGIQRKFRSFWSFMGLLVRVNRPFLTSFSSSLKDITQYLMRKPLGLRQTLLPWKPLSRIHSLRFSMTAICPGSKTILVLTLLYRMK